MGVHDTKTTGFRGYILGPSYPKTSIERMLIRGFALPEMKATPSMDLASAGDIAENLVTWLSWTTPSPHHKPSVIGLSA